MQRLDKKIHELFPDFSRSRIEGLVKSGHVTVNGATAEKAGMKVSDSDEIEVEIPPPVPAIPEPEDIPLDVVFEDDDMIVINKAPGMVVHIVKLRSGSGSPNARSSFFLYSSGGAAKLAVERRSERADTAYSPRFREEELPAIANEQSAAITSCRP